MPPPYSRVLYIFCCTATCLPPTAVCSYFVCCTATCLPPTAVCSIFCLLYCHVPPPYGRVLYILFVVLPRASPLRPCALYFVCCTATCLPPTAVCSIFCLLYCHVPPPYGRVLCVFFFPSSATRSVRRVARRSNCLYEHIQTWKGINMYCHVTTCHDVSRVSYDCLVVGSDGYGVDWVNVSEAAMMPYGSASISSLNRTAPLHLGSSL